MPTACSPKPDLRALWDWSGLLPAATAQSLCIAKGDKTEPDLRQRHRGLFSKPCHNWDQSRQMTGHRGGASGGIMYNIHQEQENQAGTE